jgi:hypothetical protein
MIPVRQADAMQVDRLVDDVEDARVYEEFLL